MPPEPKNRRRCAVQKIGSIGSRIRPAGLGGVRLALLLGCAATGAVAAEPQVEILVYGSDDLAAHYDYITWAPAPALVRVVPKPGTTPDATVSVVLTNESPAGGGKGHINFAPSAEQYRKALESGIGNLDRLTLTLRADGTPQPIVVAGAFPNFSRRDKDAVIIARQGSATGPVLGRAALMVRVRRNEETLSPEEKSRFLWALAALRFAKTGDPKWPDRYAFMVDMHDVGARGFPNEYPDQEHKASGFLPWHRTFLLELERDLQKIDPSVTLPYWPMYLTVNGGPASVFQPSFTGANTVTANADFYMPELIRFDFGNPLYGWDMAGSGPLMRWTLDRTQVARFTKPGDLIDNSGNPVKERFSFAAGSIESNPHNIGHGWSGMWMSNCMISPSDPMFWPFHTYFDWLWAAWQQHYDRFDRSGATVADYWPNDAYKEGDPATGQIPIGHHLKDTMWPWNLEAQPTPAPVYNSRRPPIVVGGRFPASGVKGIWPAEPAMPTPADLIDYNGYAERGDDSGVAYDNIPWSPKQKAPPFPGDAQPDAAALAAFLDASKAPAERAGRAAHADLAQAATPEMLAAIKSAALAPETPPVVRAAALALLARVDTAGAVEAAFKLDLRGADPKLAAEIEADRGLRFFANRPLELAAPPEAQQPEAAAPKAGAGLDKSLYQSARGKVPDNDHGIVATLTTALDQFLERPEAPLAILPQDAVAFIASTNLFQTVPSAGPAQHANMAAAADAPGFSQAATLRTMHSLLKTAPRPVAGVDWWKTKALAATVLAHDPGADAEQLIVDLITEPAAPVEARAAGLNSLRHRGSGASFEMVAFQTAADRSAPAALRAHAIAAIGAYVTDRSTAMAGEDRVRLAHALAQLRQRGLSPDGLAALETAERLVSLIPAER
jgi:hypothetical protein